MIALIHLIYASRETEPFSEDSLKSLVMKAGERNGPLGVTGMLLYDRGSFMQVLEGEESTVDALFQKISEDPRHSSVVQIIREAIPARQFGTWNMGYGTLRTEMLKSLGELDDFYATRRYLEQLNPGRAQKLLKAFCRGRWHVG